MATITASRFRQLLASDPGFIVDFIVGNNSNAVADKLAVWVSTRPATVQSIEEALQYLLNNGRGEDFVEALSVPLDLGGLTTEQATAAFANVPVGYSAERGLAKELALRALRLYDAAVVEPEAEEAETVADTVVNAITSPNQAPKHRAIRMALLALAFVGFVALVAIGVKALKKA